MSLPWGKRCARLLWRRHLTLQVLADRSVVRLGGSWLRTDVAPRLRLVPQRGALPFGWLHVRLRAVSTQPWALAWDLADGKRSRVMFSKDVLWMVCHVPHGVCALWLEPLGLAQHLGAVHLDVQQISAAEALLRLLRRAPLSGRPALGDWPLLGLQALLERLEPPPTWDAAQWLSRFATLSRRDEDLIRQRAQGLPAVQMAVISSDPAALRGQLYAHAQVVAPQKALPDDVVWVAVLRPDDALAPHALYAVAQYAQRRPDVQLFTCDFESADGHPQLIAPYNVEGLRSAPFAPPLCFVHRQLWERLGECGLHLTHPQALLLQAMDLAAPRQHIPQVLLRSAGPLEPLPDAWLQGYLRARLPRTIGVQLKPGLLPGSRRVVYTHSNTPLVSAIIPTRDHVELLQRCVETLQRTSYASLEIIVVDNQSRLASTRAFLRGLSQHLRVQLLSYDAPFNYAAMNNLAVRNARGSVLALLNNDLEFHQPGWLDELMMHALCPEVGAVAPLLLYPNGLIQHAGVVLGVGGVAAHGYQAMPPDSHGHLGRLRFANNYSAVSAACMVVQKRHYECIGGMDERLRVAFNDVDFCLRLTRDHGLRHVFTPHTEVIHHESQSRPKDYSRARRRRFAEEVALMHKRHGDALQQDPAYNANLTLSRTDFSLAAQPRVAPLWR